MSSTLLARIADRALNRPLLVTPEKAQVILQVLGGRIGVDGPSADRFEGDQIERDDKGNIVRDAWGDPKPAKYATIDGSIAVVSIVGSLVNRGAWIGANSGLVSYEGIKHQLKAVAAAPNITAVLLDIDSPGGEAIGAFEVAQMVRGLAETKTVVALVNGMACSAAYAIASGATRIVTTPSGVCGSIGVVLLHADFSKHLAQDGIKPTLIFAGDHKVDGNPFEPLSGEVTERLQAEVNAFYGMFLDTVAAGRGAAMDTKAARATKAQTFMGEQAVAVGLADAVGTFESVRDDLSRAHSGRPTSHQRSTLMSEKPGAPAAETNAGISESDHQAAVAAARQEGARAAMDRVAAVLSAEGVAGNAARMTAALDLAAASPDMAVDAVVGFACKVGSDAKPAPVKGAASLDKRADADPLGSAIASGAGSPKPKSGLTRLIDNQVGQSAA